jgi:2-amino-4-hydroxy-6-hydroxymethyldihydropteridine diphosphokinase/dihydropteroate synthase
MISMGSNQGNRLLNLQQASALLKERFFPDLEESIVLETAAILPEGGPPSWNKPYLNMVVQGNTTAFPEDLLQGLKTIEHDLGRPLNYERWAPRLIDLDILVWDDKIIDMPNLKIPHPELLNRPFLLHLLALMNPQNRYKALAPHPYAYKTFGEIAHSQEGMSNCFSRSFVLRPQLVGIVNITPDSMSDGGLYINPHQAIAKVLRLEEEGASVIELGAQSTRPKAEVIDPTEEYRRLQPVLEGLSDHIKNKNMTLSIDTFSSEVILKAIRDYPVSWINDVTGNLDAITLRHVAEAGCKVVWMHSLDVPANKKQCIPFGRDPLETVSEGAEKAVGHLMACGFTKDTIILDPGIGFGKSAYQDLVLLRHVKILKKFGCQVLVGHSRKYYLSSFYPSSPPMRDLETIAVSEELARLEVDYLRVHNIADHQRFFVAKKVFEGTQ